MDLTVSQARRPSPLAPRLALSIAAGALLTLVGAWAIQWRGTPPCDLCLLERDPYYLGVPLALATAAAAAGRWRAARAGLLVLAALFAGSAVLGAYHAGVEWHLWAGPTGCTGAATAPAAIDDFLKQLETVKVVRCDAAALRILGVSLAGWNAVVSAGLAVLAVLGWRADRTRPGPVPIPAKTAAEVRPAPRL